MQNYFRSLGEISYADFTARTSSILYHHTHKENVAWAVLELPITPYLKYNLAISINPLLFYCSLFFTLDLHYAAMRHLKNLEGQGVSTT